MASDTEQLKFTEKLGYGLGDTASNFFFQVFNIFLLYYYTDIFGELTYIIWPTFYCILFEIR